MKLFLSFIITFFFCNGLSAQNVGIGTTTPEAKLDIRGMFSIPSIPGPTSTATINLILVQIVLTIYT